MVIFIFGENSYSSKERLDILKKEFINRYGEINLITINDQNLDSITNVVSHIEAVPFLADKRMMVFQSILSSKKDSKMTKLKENLISAIENIPESTILVFYESEASFDKRQSLYKKLKKIAKVEEFKKLNDVKLKDFILNKFKRESCQIDSKELNLLTDLSRDKDTWTIYHELEQLTLYLKSDKREKVTEEDIKEVISVSFQVKIFDLIDFIGKKKQKEALEGMNNLLLSGGNEFYILSMIVYQFRNLILVKSLTYKNRTREEIIQELKLHPFVASKALSQVANYSFDELKEIYQKILFIERDIKMGEKDSKLALTTFIAEVSNK